MIKRLSTLKERQEIKQNKDFKNIDAKSITNEQLKKLVILIAKKMRII